eukprot:4956383-Amphidinium_carterae.1
MATMQQGMSTTDTELRDKMETMQQSMMETMQQSMNTMQGPNPPAWFVRVIFVNSNNCSLNYEVPLWIRGANITKYDLKRFT